MPLIFKKKIGNRESTRFWLDNWLGGPTLKETFPHIFRLDNQPNCLVCDRVPDTNNRPRDANTLSPNTPIHSINNLPPNLHFTWAWTRPIRSNIEQAEIVDISNMLSNLVLSPSCDIWECIINDTRSFSAKGLRTHITNTTIALDQNHPRWNKLVPIKVNIASWGIAKGRLATKINLDLRGIDLHSVRCPLCDDDLETEEHLFIHCRISKQVWLDVLRWWNFSNANFSTINELFSLADHVRLTPNRIGCFNVVIHTTLWFLWRTRNELVFASKTPNKDLIIKHYSHTWISSRHKNCSLNWR